MHVTEMLPARNRFERRSQPQGYLEKLECMLTREEWGSVLTREVTQRMVPSSKQRSVPARVLPEATSSRLSLVLAFAVLLFVVFGTVQARSAAAQAGSDQYDSGQPTGLMIEVTGTLERLDPATYGYGEYQLTDEASGELFALDDGDQGLLEPYVGQRVTVTGTEPAATQSPQDPRLLNVIQVEPAGQPPEGPDNTGSITFEVETEGVVPQGIEFFGVYGEPTDPHGGIPPFSELGIVNLHDSDGDGTYIGVADVPQGESLALIARGNTAGPERQIHPQSTVQHAATINVDGAETVSTTVSFPEAPAETPDYDQYDTGGTGALPSGTGEVEIEVLPDTGGPSPLTLAATFAAASLVLLAGAGIAVAALRPARRR